MAPPTLTLKGAPVVEGVTGEGGVHVVGGVVVPPAHVSVTALLYPPVAVSEPERVDVCDPKTVSGEFEMAMT